MIYQDTKRFLKKHLKSPRLDYEWGTKDNLLFLKFLESRFSSQELDLAPMEVREAVRDFFEPLCKVIVNFSKDKGIVYKCFEYRTEPKDSKHLEQIIHIIQSNYKHIEYPFQGKNDLICLMGKIRRLINMEIHDSDESINKKKLIKYAITKALNLDSRDVVFYLKRKYLVKIFDKNLYLASKRNIDSPKQRDVSVEKFNGFDEDELQSHYELLFEDVDIDDFLNLVVSELFIQKINFAKIDTTFFEKYALRAIRDILASELTHYTDANKEYLIGFAGYIFRKNFHYVYLKIASVILEEIANDNKDALEFLKHYSGETILLDGEKYKVPSLEKEDGSKWIIQSAIAISTMWVKTKQKIDKLSLSSNDIDARLSLSSDAEIEIEKLEETKNALHQELDTLNIEMEHKKFDRNVIKEFHGHSDAFQIELTSMKEKISQVEMSISEVESEIEVMISKNKEAMNEKKKLLILKTKTQNDMNILNQNLKVNNKLYQSILSSLANALTKKRVSV